MAIEETAEYQGKYFILYGLLSPADNITEKELGFDKLFMMLQKMDSIEELILAVSLSYEGIATSYSIKEQIANPLGIKVSRLRCGLPFGQSNIEYVDSKTIAYALKDRKDLIDY
jgi:recombination protein RecR